MNKRIVCATMRRLTCLWLVASLLFLISPLASAAIRGVYVGNDFYPPSAAAETSAKQSGFNTLFLFTLHIRANGDVYYNDTLVAANGSYVGNSTWGSRLASLRSGGRITRIEMCIGSWGSTAFDSIRDLVASQGTGTGSILYRNMLAIKNATGVDAIQYDDEKTYHTSSAVAFGQMLAGMGLKVTLCPYHWGYRTFWQSVKSQLGANCDAIYLQCYDGGAGNNPADWNNLFGGFKVYPGLWGNTDTVASTISKMRNWRQSLGMNGGFLWLNGGLPGDALKWGHALKLSLDPIPYVMFVNKNSGKCLDLIGGNTSDGAPIRQWSFDYNGANQRWALQPTENGDHFMLLSWVSGKALSVVNNSTSDSALIHAWDYAGNNPGQQWDLVDAGNGWSKIRNVNSGKILDVANFSTADNANVVQYADVSGTNQLWRVQMWGDYFIKASTGKYVCVEHAGGSNGNLIVQYSWENNPWFKWRFQNVGEGNWRVSSLNALGRVLCVVQASQTAAANTHLWDYNAANGGDQKVRIRPLTNGRYKFYFVHDGMSWDIPGGQTGNYVRLQQYPDNGFPWQQFALERAQ